MTSAPIKERMVEVHSSRGGCGGYCPYISESATVGGITETFAGGVADAVDARIRVANIDH